MAVDIDRLASIFKQAAAAAAAADTDHEDGGSCNCDTPAFRIERARESDIMKAAKLADVRVESFTWFGGKRWYWLCVRMHGQGFRRSRMMKAAQAVLNAAQQDIPGMTACGYYQVD